MQNLRLFKGLLLLFLAAHLISCGDEQKERPVKNGVDAEILNLIDSTIRFESVVSPIDHMRGLGPKFSKSITVDSNGIFVEPMDLEEGYYHLVYDENYVRYFVQKGKRLSVDFDASKPMAKPEFSGKLKYESRYLFDKHVVVSNFRANAGRYYRMNERDFVESVKQVRGKLDTMLVQYITNHPTGSEIFMKQEMLSNFFMEAKLLEYYPKKHAQEVGHFNDTLSEFYFADLDQINRNDSNGLTNHDYYDYLEAVLFGRMPHPSDTGTLHQNLDFIQSTITNPEVQDYLYCVTARKVTTWEDTPERVIALDTILGLISDFKIQEHLTTVITSDTTVVVPVEAIIEE